MKLISSLQLHHIFKNPSDYQAVTPWNLLVVLLHQPHLYEFTIFQLSLWEQKSHIPTAMNPLLLLVVYWSRQMWQGRGSDLWLSCCWEDVKGALGHLSPFWEPHTDLSSSTGPGRCPNLSFMCYSHKEQVTACGFPSSLTISLFFSGWWLIQEFFGIIAHN